MAEVMKSSGLPVPIPGMAEMKGKGTFFECAPYGTCWEPNGAENARRADSHEAAAMPATRQAVAATANPSLDESSGQTLPVDSLMASFPCVPASIRYRIEKDPKTGKVRLVDLGFGIRPAEYEWAVCHAGTWIHHRRHYVWVAGHKRHHLEPIRWVKGGKTLGFVPLHPFDVKDQPPLNRKEKVFAPIIGKRGSEIAIAEVHFEADRPITFLKEPPREFRDVPLCPLAQAESPHMETHHFEMGLGGKLQIAKSGTPLSFDHRQQSFMMPTQVVHGGHSVTVTAPVSNRGGNLQSRGGSFAGSSGGGSHGGGGSTGGGSGTNSGGSVSGGGTTTASSSSTSTSTATSTAAPAATISPSTGSHH